MHKIKNTSFEKEGGNCVSEQLMVLQCSECLNLKQRNGI